MSLDAAKLEKVRELPGGIVQARCPACAEGGHDRTGEHLRVYPDGRFGCCVHPKDKEHRKRIFALAGCKRHGPSTGTFSLRIKTPPALPPAKSVKATLTAFNAGTPKTESENSVPSVPALSRSVGRPNVGTLGTGNSELCARARVDSTTDHIDIGEDFHEELKDLESGVPSVPTAVAAEPPITAGERLPFLTADGTLSIPFDSPERYHWWKPDGERQTIAETLREVKERIKNADDV